MKVIILLAGYGTRMRPHTWSRPKALMKVAGNTVIGHFLDEMQDVLTEEVIFVVGYRGKQIREWIDHHYPHLNTHYVFQETALGQAHAVYLCRSFLEDDGEIIVAFGDGVVRANYVDFATIAGEDADAVFTVQMIEDPRPFGVTVTDDAGYVTQFVEKPETTENKACAVGVNWFRSSQYLLDALITIMKENRQTKGEFYMADAYQVMLEKKAKIRTMPVTYWLDAGKPGHILDTNRQLLGHGTGVSQDALERGYGEAFTVIPPVYIHETADIEASVIGPYAHIDKNVTIRGSVIRNSIIDPGATVEDCILDQALIGEQATVKGHSAGMFVGDRSTINLA